MQGRRDLSFLPTKKKPAPAGNEEGRMIPAAKEDRMYSSMACRSGAEREYVPWGVKSPEGDQWRNHRDGEEALALLKTSLRSW